MLDALANCAAIRFRIGRRVMARMEAVFGRMRFPEEPPRHWRSRIELAARMLWATFRRHLWLAPAMSVTRPQLIPSALPFMKWVLGALDGHGLDAVTMLTAYITVFNHIRGTAINLEFEAEAEALTGLDADAWMDARKSAFDAITAGAGCRCSSASRRPEDTTSTWTPCSSSACSGFSTASRRSSPERAERGRGQRRGSGSPVSAAGTGSRRRASRRRM